MKMNHPLNQSPPSKTRLGLIVGALAAVAVICSSSAQSVFTDNFDSYANQAAFTAAWQASTIGVQLTLTNTQKHSGTQSIMQGAAAATSAAPWSSHVTSENLYFRCWYYDSLNGARSWAAPEAITSDTTYSGAGYTQKLGIGRYNNITGSKYYGRLANSTTGGTSEGATALSSGWCQLGGAANASVGWHKFEIVGLRQTDLSIKYRYYVDGVLGGAATDSGGNRSFNWSVCGGGVSNGTGPDYYDDVVVEALTMTPQIDTPPAALAVNELQPAAFTVHASAGGTTNTYALNTLKYQWQYNDADISGATASSYTIPSATIAGNQGNYRCIVTDAYGRVPATSDEAYLTVNAVQSPVIDSATGGGVVNQGSSATFTVAAHGNTPLNYTWKRNGSQVATGTDSSYTINAVAGTDSGTYTCVVANGTLPNATNGNLVLTVNLPPTLTAPAATIPLAAKLEFRMHASSTPALSAEGTMVQDFEAYGDGSLVMFAQPSFSGTTSANLDLGTGVPNSAAVTEAYPAGHLSPRVLKSSFTWNGTGAGTLRFTTSSTQVGNRPIISYTNRLRFDICSDKSLLVGVGARDTSPTGAIGVSDPTTSGQIEWIGVTAALPSRTVTANTWTTLDFNPLTDPIQSAWSVGNGVLDSTTGKGQLEDLYLVHVDALPNDNNVYLDNFIVLAAHPITFTLGSGAPADATIDQYTGKITWAPTVLGDVSFQVTATDDYGLSTTQTYTVKVVPSPARIDSITNNVGDVTITGHGAPNQSFHLRSSTNLSAHPSAWTIEDTDSSKTGTFSFLVLGPMAAEKFFLIESY